MANLFHKTLKKAAHFQLKHPYLVTLLIAMATIAMLGGATKLKTVASLEQMMPESIEEIRAFHTLRDSYLGQDIIAIVLSLDRNSTDKNGINDITSPEVLGYISHLESELKSEPDVIETYSLYSYLVLRYGKAAFYEDGRIDKSKLKGLLKKTDISSYADKEKTTTIVLATTDVSADDHRMGLLSTKIKSIISSAGHPPGISIRLTGTPLIQQKLGKLIEKDRTETKDISSSFVFIITMLIFGTLTSAVVPITIVTISVNWLYGTMGYSGLPISTLAGGVAAMVIGIGIDFAIHIINKFKYERKRGLSLEQAIETAVVETGTALTASSVTTITAFLAFLVGTMPEMGRFGILMAIGIGYSLLFSLFGLPSLLIIEEQLIAFLRRHLKFGVEGELMLRKKDEVCENAR